MYKNLFSEITIEGVTLKTPLRDRADFQGYQPCLSAGQRWPEEMTTLLARRPTTTSGSRPFSMIS